MVKYYDLNISEYSLWEAVKNYNALYSKNKCILEKAHICEKLPIVVSLFTPPFGNLPLYQNGNLISIKEGSRVHSLVATTLQEREK